MKKIIISLVILIIIITTIICIFNKNIQPEYEDNKLNIITSIYPIYDFTKQIAGEKANVTMLLPTGVEVHDYEPTPQDVIHIKNSDLFLFLGKELEPWGDTLVSGIEDSENIKDISENINLIENEEFEKEYFNEEHDEHEEHEKYDTHIWLDPTKSVTIVENIEKELIAKDPQNADYYKNNAENYIKKLNKLDEDIKNVVDNADKQEIAFGGPFSYAYFIKRYNIKFVTAYDSCGENGEPSVDKVFSVINEIKKNNLPVVFFKEMSSANIAKTIAEETGAEKLEFNSLHTVTKEQLENGENYLSIMYKNVENLKTAMQSKEK